MHYLSKGAPIHLELFKYQFYKNVLFNKCIDGYWK